MDYSILKSWCSQMASLEADLRSIGRQAELVCLSFKDGQELIFLLHNQDAYAFLQSASLGHWEDIWPFLKHARLGGFRIDKADRIIHCELDQTDIYQQKRRFILIAELMPPKPNLILCELKDAKWIIIDAIHKYSFADNPARQILPSFEYMPPKTKWKPEQLPQPSSFVFQDPYSQEMQQFEDANSYLAEHYKRVIQAKETQQRRQRQLAGWKRLEDKQKKKLAKQRIELEEASEMDTWKLYAEVIKYNLDTLKAGQSYLESLNYFDPDLGMIKIPLKEDLNPNQNLKMYIKRYQKAKKGLDLIQQKIQSSEAELKRLWDVLARVEAGEDLDPKLGQEGQAKGKGKLELLDKLLKIRISDEFEIVIGRKAKENDFISTKLGRPHDWWFHTRVFRGAHVLLRCHKKTHPPEDLMLICCRLAAWFSKARFSSNVPIDYTQVRFLRKPRGSAAGFVIYSNQQTAYVDPLDPRHAREILAL